MYRVGVDVGGTNTDAAILDITSLDEDSRGVLATCKTPTTANVTDGIENAIDEVLTKSEVDRDKILNVAIGTTHFVNAVLEVDSRRLSRVAVVRLCGPYTRKNPPFSDFPYSLRKVVEGPHYYLDGGLEIDGREISQLDLVQIQETVSKIRAEGIDVVAIVGVFSALDTEGVHEERCKSIMLSAFPDLSVVCSHTIGGPGLLERENATILNAAILKFARRTVAGFQRAMKQLNLSCGLYVTQNDGTLADAASAAALPVKTFASGPTNSLMGAAFLQGFGQGGKTVANKQVIVVDIGGTTTDVCALLPSGFPRQAASFVEVGGVRTAFSMPDVFSIALGGGSRVKAYGETASVTVGPDSVAHRLLQDAIVFGGDVLTTTDAVVASGDAYVGDPSLVKDISSGTIVKTKQQIKNMLENAVDVMKVSSAPVVVLLVGGGSILVTEKLEGVEECLCPPHHDSANAVGAAIAKVAGEVDVIEILAGKDEEQVFQSIKQKAIESAQTKGADPQDTHVADVKKIGLQYVTNKATRFVVKAVGSLRISEAGAGKTLAQIEGSDHTDENGFVEEGRKVEVLKQDLGSMAKPTLGVDLRNYRPSVKDGVWCISPIDVELLASGTGVLGTGGGGSSYNMALYILDILRKGGKMTVVKPSALKDDDLCVFGAGFGAPSVSNERISSGQEVFDAIDWVNKVMSYHDFAGIVADEIGGGNGIVTFPSSAHYDRPVIDCDLMGRAYPTIEHGTPYLNGHPICPCATVDGKGNVVFAMVAESYRKVEGIIRTACIELGNATATAGRPLTADVMKKYAIPNTVSQAWFLGRAVHLARKEKIDFIDAIADVTPIKRLYSGKIIDVTRDVSRGYTIGKVILAPLTSDESVEGQGLKEPEKRNLVIPFQNEYLSAALVDLEDPNGTEDMLCTVPDLISILGQDGEAIGSPELRYGLRCQVIGMPAHPLWTGTELGMKVGGPEFFGLGVEFKSIGEYELPRSVIDEYNV